MICHYALCVSTQYVVVSYFFFLCCQVRLPEGCKFVSTCSHGVKPKQMDLYSLWFCCSLIVGK